jgi:hypothetical protein
VWTFFIFWPDKIHINPTSVILLPFPSLVPPLLRSTSPRRCAVLCFLLMEPRRAHRLPSASSFGNVLSRRLPSRAETESLNPHHRCRPPSLDSPPPALCCYKKAIPALATLPTTQLRLHLASLPSSSLWVSMCRGSPESLVRLTPDHLSRSRARLRRTASPSPLQVHGGLTPSCGPRPMHQVHRISNI